MDYIKVTIKTKSDATDMLCALLTDIGITGFEIDDKKDFDDFVENCKDKYDYIDESLLNAPSKEPTVSFYVASNAVGMDTIAQTNTLLNSLSSKSEFGSLVMETKSMAEEEWSETWKRFFHPTPIGKKILVVPEWEHPENVEDRIEFHINPGMVFGTGTHESTKMCIEMSEKYVKGNERVLDLGCGSGILSIISRLLGANYALGVDIDRNAEENAYSNASLNDINENYKIMIGDVTNSAFAKTLGQEYDIVFANIVASVIIMLAPHISQFLKDDGVFITSGIIVEKLGEVMKVLDENGLSVIDSTQERGWACLVLKKK